MRYIGSITLSLFVAVCLCPAMVGQSARRIESMKLLTDNVGWAATDNRVFWTTDNGANWKDITPKFKHQVQMVSSVFFLDTSTGWVLMKCADDKDNVADEGCWEVAATSDAGQSWEVLHENITVPFSREQVEEGHNFSGISWLEFIDPQHGWEILDIATNSANPSAGEMLRTVDGGKTWMPTKGAPTSDHFHFVSTTDGWIAGGKDHELYATHDSGDSWNKVLLPSPASTEPNLGVDFGLPLFEGTRRGYIPAEYSVGPVVGPYLTTIVLFVTDDGGQSWKQDRILPRLPGTFVVAMAASNLIAIHSEPSAPGKATKLQLYTEGTGHAETNNTATISSRGSARLLSFVNSAEGWTDMADNLFTTKDSGITWIEITPPSGSNGLRRRGQERSANASEETPEVNIDDSRSPLAGIAPASGSPISQHLGFDAYNVPASTPTMSAWMSSSPFYDIGVYLQGSKNGHKDPILGSANGPAWVSTVESQGWGLIPTWVGEQSPCACRTVKGQCVQYASVLARTRTQMVQLRQMPPFRAPNLSGSLHRLSTRT